MTADGASRRDPILPDDTLALSIDMQQQPAEITDRLRIQLQKTQVSSDEMP
jgi:hypothetical protein